MASPSRNVWRRLTRNKGALIGITIISAAIVIAIISYLIAPDSTPNANRMIVEIGGQKPGYTQQFVMVKRERPIERKSFINRMISGQEDPFQLVPIAGGAWKSDAFVANRYIDEGVYEPIALTPSQLAAEGEVNENHFTKTLKFWLGTDKYGRDILSRLLIGTRVSLGVGCIAVIISLTIGILLGSLAGYFGGWVDQVVMWFINVLWSIPTLLLVFAITLLLGKGYWQVFIAIGLTMWVNVARIIRGQVLAVRELEFVEAARALGYSDTRILYRHVLPNVMGPVMVVAAANFASAIVIEAGLSFLGVGVQPPQPSWGLMIKENYNFIITQNPMLALAPGFAIMLLVLAFNLLGNGMRDAMQVKES